MDSIDPAAWLAEHDPDAARHDPFSAAHDVMILGGDELAEFDGDLSRALAARPDFRAEIVLFWLGERMLEEGPAAAPKLIMLAATIIGRLSAEAGTS